MTGESWHLLQRLARGQTFVLIGGWAAYLHTRAQKSKDIDIVVDFEALRQLDSEFGLAKNDRLMKYEIKHGEVDVDIYVPKFSRLSYPVEKILENHDVVDGIRVATVPQLLLLKLGAYQDRKGSAKGEKDAIDIVSILYSAKFDKGAFEKAAAGSEVEKPLKLLCDVVSEFPESSLPFVGADYVAFKKWRREFLKSR